MWIVPPSVVSQAPACSTSPGNSPPSDSDCELALWLTVSGKPMLRPASWRGWKTRPWSQRLFGAAISVSSHSNRYMAELLLSLEASHAMTSRSPASEPDSQESDQACGSTCSASQTNSTPSGSCSRTSQGSITCQLENGQWVTSQRMLFSDHSEPYCGRLPKAGGMRNGVIFARTPWEPATSASDGSAWPTATTDSFRDRDKPYSQGGTPLALAVKWPTAKATDGTKGGPNQRGSSGDMTLPSATVKWPTATALDSRSSQNTGCANPGVTLTTAAKNWQTPTTPRGGSVTRGGTRSNELLLNGQAAQWATPQARDHKGDGGSQQTHNARPLNEQVRHWATPCVAEERQGTTGISEAQVAKGARILSHDVGSFMHRDKMQTGSTSHADSPTSPRRLNPAFVSWLMGWPWWWIRTEPLPFASLEAELFRCKLRSELQRALNG